MRFSWAMVYRKNGAVCFWLLNMRKIILFSNRFFYILLLKRSNINTIKLHVPQNTRAHTNTHARSSCGLALWSSCWGEWLTVCKCLPVQTQDYPRNQFWLFFCRLIRKLLSVSQKLALHMIWGHKYPYRNGIFCNMLKNYIDKIRTRDCNISKYMLKYTKDCHFQIVQKCFFFVNI